jgi:hypothetical protein
MQLALGECEEVSASEVDELESDVGEVRYHVRLE